jgi:tetratricopeptide (TPR) repeat protein
MSTVELFEIKPDSANVYNASGLALAGQKKYEEAIVQYQKAIELDPHYTDAYIAWGNALANQRKYDEAIAKYQKAIELDPHYTDAYNNWGLALGDLNRYEEAIEKSQQAIQLDNNYVYAYHNIAYYLWRQGKYQIGWEAWEKARRVYEQTSNKAKDNHNTYHFLYYGYVLYKFLGQLNKAEEVFREGLQLDPEHTGILMNLVDLYLKQKEEKPDESTTVYRRAYENYRKAKRLLEEQLQKDEDFFTLMQLGELLLTIEENPEILKTENYAVVGNYFSKALEKDPESAWPYASLGVLYIRREEFKKAVQFFEAALKRDPDDFTIWSNLAESYHKAKLSEKAETEYRKILRIAAGHIDSQIGLGEVYSAMAEEGDSELYEQAISYYTEAIKLHDTRKGSKWLTKKELAAVYYARGYARVKLHEASGSVGDESSLSQALDDFRKCAKYDPDHHKSERTKEKLEKRFARFSSQRLVERIGRVLVIGSSFAILVFASTSFFFGKPLASLETSLYLALVLGLLTFLMVGVYLPQILKLKVPGVELEKSSVDQITTPLPLGIKK